MPLKRSFLRLMSRRFLLLGLLTLILGGGAFFLAQRWQGSSDSSYAIHTSPLPVLTEGTSILTWNLQYFPGRTQSSPGPAAEQKHVEAVAEVLREADADILCLQEVKGDEAVDLLLAKLPEYRAQVVSTFWGVQELAILSKADATTAFTEEFVKGEVSDPPRGFAHSAYDFGGHRLLVYSVHLKSNAGAGGIQGNIPVREESARQLLRHVEDATALHKRDGAESVTVVLAGDFNTSLVAEEFAAEQTGGLILEAGFDWGFRGLPEEETVTWLTDGRYPDNTFDHIFFKSDGESEAGRSTTIPTDRSVSDHRPVVMRVLLPGA